MDDYLVAAIHLVLVTPCLFLGMYFYKRQRKEPDARQRILQRLAIIWCVAIFIVVSLSVDYLWATYISDV